MYKKISFMFVFIIIVLTIFSINTFGVDCNGGIYILNETDSIIGYQFNAGEYAGWKVSINSEFTEEDILKCLEAAAEKKFIPLTDLKALEGMDDDFVYQVNDWSYDYNLINAMNEKIKIENQMEIYSQIIDPEEIVKAPEAGKYFLRSSEKKGQEIPVEYALYLGLLPDKEQFCEYWKICKTQTNTFKNEFEYQGKVLINDLGCIFHNINNNCDDKSEIEINILLAFAKGYIPCNKCFISPTIAPTITPTNTIDLTPTSTIDPTATISQSTIDPTATVNQSTIEPTDTQIINTSNNDLPKTGEENSILVIILGISLSLTGFICYKYRDKIDKFLKD